MIPRLLLFLSTAAIVCGGEAIRFDAKTGPGGREGSCHGYLFDDLRETIRVVDREKPVTTEGQTLGDAFAGIGAFAGCSGGMTTPDGKPIGLIISDGKQVSPVDAGAESGGVLVLRDGRIFLETASTAQSGSAGVITQGLQCGPILVDDGKPAAGLDTKFFGRRCVIVSSGKGQWAILYIPSATMDGLARMLADKTTFPKFPVVRALSLGTGLSSAVWIARSESALPLYLKEVNPVRSGIAILPKVH
ncbi:MAG: phosphodiester glycosidase family protein [Luteolibacter sp.]